MFPLHGNNIQDLESITLDNKFECENILKNIEQNKYSREELLWASDIVREVLRKFPLTKVSEKTKILKESFLGLKPQANRYDLLEYCLKNRLKENGVAVEFGVWNGHSLNYIARCIPNNKVYGFDYFKDGLTFTTESNVFLVKGAFEDNKDYDFKDEVSFIHIDPDTYESAREVLFNYNHLIKSGTIIQFDELLDFNSDENDKWFLGEWKAIEEWSEVFGREYKAFGRDFSCRGAIIVC